MNAKTIDKVENYLTNIGFEDFYIAKTNIPTLVSFRGSPHYKVAFKLGGSDVWEEIEIPASFWEED